MWAVSQRGIAGTCPPSPGIKDLVAQTEGCHPPVQVQLLHLVPRVAPCWALSHHLLRAASVPQQPCYRLHSWVCHKPVLSGA
jgi:hypothetical protein